MLSPVVPMKTPSFPFISISALFLVFLLPIVGIARSGWEPWEVVVLCLVFFGAASAFTVYSLRPAVVGHGARGAVACSARPGPAWLEDGVIEDSDSTPREGRDEDCTVWDCF